MSEFNFDIEGGTSMRLKTAGKYCDRDIVVNAVDTGFPNGTEWTLSNVSIGGHAVAYGNGIWLIEVDSSVYYSSDGKTWTKSDLSYVGANNFTYANGVWMLSSTHIHVGGTSTGEETVGGLYTSTDGKIWSSITVVDSVEEVNVNGIACANGIWFAAVGAVDASGLDYEGLYYSYDGQTWTQTNFTGDTYRYCLPMYANGLWAMSTSTGIYYSTDGITWTLSNVTSGPGAIWYADGLWIASPGSNSGIWHSVDGKTWVQSDVTTGTWSNFSKGNGLWVASKTDRYLQYSYLYYSVDGVTWIESAGFPSQVKPLNHTTYGRNRVGDIEYANGIWVASGYCYTYHSVDGKNWVRNMNSQITPTTFQYANGIWVMCSGKGIYYSVAWEPST